MTIAVDMGRKTTKTNKKKTKRDDGLLPVLVIPKPSLDSLALAVSKIGRNDSYS